MPYPPTMGAAPPRRKQRRRSEFRSLLDTATTITGGRVRIPVSLLADHRRYSANAVAVYANVEKLDDRERPCYAGRAWFGTRLGGASIATVGRAIGQLTANDPWPRIVSFQPTQYATSDRWCVRIDSEEFVTVPAWTLDLLEDQQVSAKAWRLYCGYLRLCGYGRDAVQGVAPTNEEIAAAAGVGASGVPKLRREAEAAGLLLVVEDGRGKPATVIPLCTRTSPEQRVSLLREARARCGQLRRTARPSSLDSSPASSESDLSGTPESETPPTGKTHTRGSDRASPSGASPPGLWTTLPERALDQLCAIRDRQCSRIMRTAHRRARALAEAEDRPPPPSWWFDHRLIWDEKRGIWWTS